MKRTQTALTVVATMFASSAFTADTADLQNLKDTRLFIWWDLAGADLSATDLSNANVKGATIKGTTLCNKTMPDGSIVYSGYSLRALISKIMLKLKVMAREWINSGYKACGY